MGPSLRRVPRVGLDPRRMRVLESATAHLDPPFAVVDGAALETNADDLVRRAGGLPVRVATKSVRVRGVLEEVLRRPGYAGLLAYSLDEALWLVEEGFRDVLVAYPAVGRGALHRLGESPAAQEQVTLVLDDVAQLDLVEACVPADARVRVAVDVDASYRLGPAVLGARRSPLRTPEQARAFARAVVARPWARLAGVMVYEAQVAGLQDSTAARIVKQASRRELATRRAAVVEAVRSVAPGTPLVVNGGGTGNLHDLAGSTVLTDVAAGSGLFAPRLFDGYDAFTPAPAAFFVTSVVRRPDPATAAVFAGGYVASGSPGADRLPTPVWPPHLRLTWLEGAGEVQTPVVGPGAAGLAVGDRVWFRHAKAGELCERFADVHVVRADGSVDTMATYRGEGKCFG